MLWLVSGCVPMTWGGGFSEASKTTSEPTRIPQYQGHTALPPDLCNPRFPSNWFLLPLVQWNQLSDLRFCFHQEPWNFHFYSSDFTFIFCFLSLWGSTLLQNPIGHRLLKFMSLQYQKIHCDVRKNPPHVHSMSNMNLVRTKNLIYWRSILLLTSPLYLGFSSCLFP